MEIGYLVIKEQYDDPMDLCQFGYPQTRYTEPIAICETPECAEELIKNLQQEEADRFMDWMDECKDYIDSGMTDSDGHNDPERGDYYFVMEVPYYQ